MTRATAPDRHYGPRQWSGWAIGPPLLLLTLITAPPQGLSVEGWRTAGAAGLMAVLWIAESIPIPATALLPLVLFPALGLGDIRETAAPFANPIIFLFLGGFNRQAFRDQGSGIRDQGSGIRDQGSGIRDQGSGIGDECQPGRASRISETKQVNRKWGQAPLEKLRPPVRN